MARSISDIVANDPAVLFGEVAKGLRLIGGASLIDAKLTRTQDGAYDGNKAVGVPDTKVNMGAAVGDDRLVIYDAYLFEDLGLFQVVFAKNLRRPTIFLLKIVTIDRRRKIISHSLQGHVSV